MIGMCGKLGGREEVYVSRLQPEKILQPPGHERKTFERCRLLSQNQMLNLDW